LDRGRDIGIDLLFGAKKATTRVGVLPEKDSPAAKKVVLDGYSTDDR
jgi:hypothetical protein